MDNRGRIGRDPKGQPDLATEDSTIAEADPAPKKRLQRFEYGLRSRKNKNYSEECSTFRNESAKFTSLFPSSKRLCQQHEISSEALSSAVPKRRKRPIDDGDAKALAHNSKKSRLAYPETATMKEIPMKLNKIVCRKKHPDNSNGSNLKDLSGKVSISNGRKKDVRAKSTEETFTVLDEIDVEDPKQTSTENRYFNGSVENSEIINQNNDPGADLVKKLQPDDLSALSVEMDDETSWRSMSLVPTPKELLGTLLCEDESLREIYRAKPYPSSEDYMEINYRLLRAECFSAIQIGIQDFLEGKSDINCYSSVRLNGFIFAHSGLSLAIQFNRNRQAQKSKKLQFGTLLCLSTNQEFDDVIWATVAEKVEKWLHCSSIIFIKICHFNKKCISEIIEELQINNGKTLMMESPTEFLPFQSNLEVLRHMKIEDFVLWNEIVSAQPSEYPPEYSHHTSVENEFQLNTEALETNDERGQRLHEKIKEVAVGLDKTQLEAFHYALETRLAIIQGPPGCGKTYLGTKLVQALMKMELDAPILIMTYKNHALDEFLKGLFTTGICPKNRIVRIGSRSSEPELEECQLNKCFKKMAYSRNINEERKNIFKKGIEVIESSLKHSLLMLSPFSVKELLSVLSDEQLNGLLINAPSPLTQGGSSLIRTSNGDLVSQRHLINVLFPKILDSFGSLSNFVQCYVKQEPAECFFSYAHQFKNALLELLKLWIPSKLKLRQETKLNENFVKKNIPGYHKNAFDMKYPYERDTDYTKEAIESRMTSSNDRYFNKLNPILFTPRQRDDDPLIISMVDIPPNMTINLPLTKENNLWSLREVERCEFVYSILAQLRSGVDEDNIRLEQALSQKKQKEMIDKVSLISKKKVIGVTISGAAIHHELLSKVSPSVVLVEEAAEILEPSLCAVLNQNVKRLILIGDHKQLPPQVETYTLRKKYAFDTSMMERLINSGYPYKALKKQSRMRPEFSALLKDIYPELEDNLDVVLNNDPPSCIQGSMYFWTHDFPEDSPRKALGKKENTSKSNLKEAEMVLALAHYFLHNGYEPSQVTILTAYLGQQKILRDMLKDKNDLCIKGQGQPKINTIDNYQGDENDVIIVSLVRSNPSGSIGFLNVLNRRCVAQSRAKCGMYFVGNVNTFEMEKHGERSVWHNFIKAMQDQNCVRDSIKLQCFKHKTVKKCKTSQDVMRADSALCTVKCGDLHPCELKEHACQSTCYPKHVHDRCTFMVEDTYPNCGHVVRRRCFEKLSDIPCQTDVQLEFKCGHTTFKKCHVNEAKLICSYPCGKKMSCGEHVCKRKCGNFHRHNFCTTEVNLTLEKCGHPITKQCHISMKDVVCNFKPCPRLRSCGHTCQNKCGEDCTKGDCQSCRKEFERFRNSKRVEAKRNLNRIKAELKLNPPKVVLIELFNQGDSKAEYLKVADKFLKYNQPMHGFRPSISKIEKVCNRKLELNFYEALTQSFGFEIDEKFHGTSDEGIKGITENGFKLPGKPKEGNRPGMFGQGIYFSSESSKSAQNIYTKNSNKLLLCKVLLGKCKEVRCADNTLDYETLKKQGYDSVFAPRGSEVKNDEFVIYNPKQAVPEYIIHYSTDVTQLNLDPGGGKTFEKIELLPPNRQFDPSDWKASYFRIAESHYRRMTAGMETRAGADYRGKSIKKIDYIVNKTLEDNFQKKKGEFKRNGHPDHEVLAFHGTPDQNIDSILQANLDPNRTPANGRAHGDGCYFSEFPDVSLGYGNGLLLFRTLPGKEYVGSSISWNQEGCHSKVVSPTGNEKYGQMLIIKDATQFMPYFVYHFD